VRFKFRFTRGILFLFARLPLPILYALASFLAFIAQYVIKYRKTVIQQNLKNSFPNYTSTQLKLIENKFYKRFAIIIVEVLMQFRQDKEFLKSRMIVSNPELLEKYHEEGRNVVAMAGHFCNWEWLGSSMGMFSSYHALGIYKTLSNKLVDELLYEIRSLNDTKLVPMEKATKTMLGYKLPLLSCFLADQAASPNNAYWTDFLHQDSPFFWGAEKIAKASNAIVVFLAMRFVKKGYYSIEIIELCDNPKLIADGEIIQMYVSALEKEIIAAPEYWLWSHKRWKHKRPQ
jgi:KDO2-lipid IV(A) lauroyltransferase